MISYCTFRQIAKGNPWKTGGGSIWPYKRFDRQPNDLPSEVIPAQGGQCILLTGIPHTGAEDVTL